MFTKIYLVYQVKGLVTWVITSHTINSKLLSINGKKVVRCQVGEG